MISLINGRSGTMVDVRDRGFAYGDGLFETAAVEAGRPLLWPLHLERLRIGCERLGMPPPEADTLHEEIEALCARGGRGVLKVTLTRGPGGRGYGPPEVPETTRVVAFLPPPSYPERLWRAGVRVRFCATALGINPALAGLKHLNRLEQVLARAEWRGTAFHEGLMCDPQGRVVEGVSSNLFARLGAVLVTPPVDRCGVAGVVRRFILEHSPLPVTEGELTRQMCLEADELFLTNGVIGLWPVARLGERAWPPRGEAAHALMALLREQGFRI